MNYTRGKLVCFLEELVRIRNKVEEGWSLADDSMLEQIIELIMKQEDEIYKESEWWKKVEESVGLLRAKNLKEIISDATPEEINQIFKRKLISKERFENIYNILKK